MDRNEGRQALSRGETPKEASSCREAQQTKPKELRFRGNPWPISSIVPDSLAKFRGVFQFSLRLSGPICVDFVEQAGKFVTGLCETVGIDQPGHGQVAVDDLHLVQVQGLQPGGLQPVKHGAQ